MFGRRRVSSMNRERASFAEEIFDIVPTPRGADKDPKKCTHPNVPEKGRVCEFCGKEIRGLIETGV